MADAHTNLELHKPENINAQWISERGTWITYTALILLVRIFLWAILGPQYHCMAWTTINIVHSIVTFVTFHWIKGSPFEGSRHKYDKYTLWEQLDWGVQWTPTRKFLMIVPIILYLITINCSDMQIDSSFWLNTGAFAIILIAKLPFMNKKRILGINS